MYNPVYMRPFEQPIGFHLPPSLLNRCQPIVIVAQNIQDKVKICEWAHESLGLRNRNRTLILYLPASLAIDCWERVDRRPSPTSCDSKMRIHLALSRILWALPPSSSSISSSFFSPSISSSFASSSASSHLFVICVLRGEAKGVTLCFLEKRSQSLKTGLGKFDIVRANGWVVFSSKPFFVVFER